MNFLSSCVRNSPNAFCISNDTVNFTSRNHLENYLEVMPSFVVELSKCFCFFVKRLSVYFSNRQTWGNILQK